jgi:hypothetical protein
MKQMITIEQLQELNDEQRQRLGGWLHINIPQKPGEHAALVDGDALPLLSIGHMIELLNDGNKRVAIEVSGGEWEVVAHSKHAAINHELCDALWDVIKEVL